MYYTLEKAVFSLKSHSPQMDKRPKRTYEIWVVLNIVVVSIGGKKHSGIRLPNF